MARIAAFVIMFWEVNKRSVRSWALQTSRANSGPPVNGAHLYDRRFGVCNLIKRMQVWREDTAAASPHDLWLDRGLISA
jgi:hypothetical protein